MEPIPAFMNMGTDFERESAFVREQRRISNQTNKVSVCVTLSSFIQGRSGTYLSQQGGGGEGGGGTPEMDEKEWLKTRK